MELSSSMAPSSASFPQRYLACLADRSAPVDDEYGRSFERLCEELAGTTGSVLRDVHGGDDPFDRFVFPFACMLVYQMLNAAYEDPPAGSQGALPSFENLAAFVANERHGAMSVALHSVWKADDPFEAALGLLGGDGNHDETPSVKASVTGNGDPGGTGRIGISVSMTSLEKWFLAVACPGQLRFVRAPRSKTFLRNNPARRDLVRRLRAAAGPGFAEAEHARFLAAAGLCLPTYLLEGFAEHRAQAESMTRNLSGLVAALEFQHRPAVALLIPVLRARGRFVVGVQHGGGWYGQTDPGLWERIEWSHSDRYVTWGYRHSPRDLALPAVRLSRFRVAEILKTRMHSLGGPDRRSILVVLPNLDSSIGWSVQSPSINRQADALRRSLALLRPAHEAGYRLVLRMHPRRTARDYETSLPDFLREGESPLAVGRGTLVANAARREAVMFTTPNASGLSECTAAGVEVGIVADPGDFHIREPARPVYRRLIDSGVWLTSETEVESFFDSPNGGGARREALAEFARQYSFRSPAYLLHWARFLRGLHRGKDSATEVR
jgi:hypothetical protein